MTTPAKTIFKPLTGRPLVTVTDREYCPPSTEVGGAFFRIKPSVDWTPEDVTRIKEQLIAKGALSVVHLPIPSASYTPELMVASPTFDPNRDIRTIASELLNNVSKEIRSRVTEILVTVLGK